MRGVGKTVACFARSHPIIGDAGEIAIVETDFSGTFSSCANHTLVSDREENEERYRKQDPVDCANPSGDNPTRRNNRDGQREQSGRSESRGGLFVPCLGLAQNLQTGAMLGFGVLMWPCGVVRHGQVSRNTICVREVVKSRGKREVASRLKVQWP